MTYIGLTDSITPGNSGVDDAPVEGTIFSDLAPMRDNVMAPYAEATAKAAALAAGGEVLAEYRKEHPDATIEDFLNDKTVPDDDKKAVLLLLAIGNNPLASPAELDGTVETMFGELQNGEAGGTDTPTLDSVLAENELLEEGGDTKIFDMKDEILELASDQTRLGINEQTLFLLKEYQTLLTALSDIFIAAQKAIGASFTKASS